MARQGHTATRLPNGQVLVTGEGVSAELYDPASRSWRPTGSLTLPRNGHTATLLATGKVLVVGLGNTAELYDPSTGRWTLTGPMATPRVDHSATLLPSGKVLVAGGDLSFTPSPSAELYDPVTGAWTSTGPMLTRRTEHTAVLLDRDPCGTLCGKVLVTGGESERSATSSATYDVDLAEIYDPVTGLWSATDAMDIGRSNHVATLLPNGTIIVAGGTTGDTSARRPTASAEIYDPLSRLWSSTGPLRTARYDHTASLLPDGQLLVAAGYTEDVSSSAELYDPGPGTWRATGSLSVRRANHSGTVLEDGTVLAAGGAGGAASAEIYGFQPFVSVGDVAVHEGDAATREAVFTVSLSRANDTAVEVSYATASGTATSPADYISQAGILRFAAGTTDLAVRVPVLGDTDNEGQEEFSLTLGSSYGATLGDANGVGTILHDDPDTQRRLAIGDVSVHEGNGGVRTAVFNVSLSTPKAGSGVTVAYSTDDKTATGTDYTPVSGTLTFSAADTSQDIAVPIYPDALAEGNHVFVLKLSRARGASVSDAVGVGTIVDDDSA